MGWFRLIATKKKGNLLWSLFEDGDVRMDQLPDHEEHSPVIMRFDQVEPDILWELLDAASFDNHELFVKQWGLTRP